MSVAALIQELNSLSVVLSLDGDKLRVNAPRGVLTEELKGKIQSERALITELLRGAQQTTVELDPVTSRDAAAAVQLTPAQHQLWFLDRLDPGSAFLNIPLVLRLTGKLDLDALSWTITELGRRHDSLVSSVVERADEPCQQPSGLSLRLEFEDYSHLPAPEREQTVLSRRDEELRRPFDFDARAPLARFFLLRQSRTDHTLLIVVNHVIFDGPSQAILLQELVQLYEARIEGLSVAPPPRRFADFARWQERVRERPERASALEYWKQKLTGMPVQLELPLDRPPPRHASHRSHGSSVLLDHELSERLRRVARAHSATVNMLALASIQVLLWRYSGQRDFGVGVPLQNRGHEDFSRLIGMFLNTVVIRSEIADSSNFSELLSRVKENQIDALSHGNVSFDELLQVLAPGRSAQRSQLFQVFYSFQDDGPSRLRAAELEIVLEPTFTGYSMTDLTFWMHDQGGRLWMALEGSSDLFDAETSARFFRSWRRLLEAISEDPSLPLAELPVMSREDEHRVLFELNETGRPWDQSALVHRLFERAVNQAPDSVALTFEEQSLSFGELDQRANRLAHLLVRRGVGPESTVGLCVHKSVEQVVAMLAILKAGGAYVGLDPTYPAERINTLLADSEARILITSSDIAPLLNHGCEQFLVDRDAPLLEAESTRRLTHAESPEQLAYIIYTSGSSGTPKGVMVAHRNVVSFFESVRQVISLDAHGAWLAGASISFDMSVIEILGSLCYGRRVVLIGDSVLGEAKNPLYTLPQLVRRHGVTHLQCTPSQAHMLLLDPAGREALASLEQLLCGGEAVPEQLASELCQLVSGEVINIYGPTETTVYATLGPMPNGGKNIGRPIPNTCLFILDESGKPVPQGAPGELCIGSPGVTRGYLKRPELTAERFIVNTIRPEVGPRLYRSGDLVRYAADGTLIYLGRNDHQVKIRGYRIELGEIESALRAVTGVTDTVVVAQGSGAEKRLVAYLVRADDYVGDDAMRNLLRARLPEFMVPRVVVHLEALPLNSNGKVDRARLPQASEVALPSQDYVAPRDESERALCAIWQKALGVTRLGIQDDFFGLGGHSLLAVKISNEVDRKFGMRLPLSTLFECPTVELFAARLAELSARPRESIAARWTTVVPIQPGGSLPPFFCVSGVGGNPMNLRHVATALGDDQPFYGLQFRGVDGQYVPHRRIRDMAEEFIADLRAVQPEGPYYVGGYSAGGLCAYEMAQLLLERNEQVGLVVFFDTLSPLVPPWAFMERVDAHIDNYRRIGHSYLSDRIVARLREEYDRARLAIRARLARNNPFKYRNDAVWRASEEAIRNYVPGGYAGDVLLLRADPRLSADGGIGYRPHESNGWRELVRGEFTVIDLACSHRDIVRAQAAELAARALKNALAAARARSRRTLPAPPSQPSQVAKRPDVSKGVRMTG